MSLRSRQPGYGDVVGNAKVIGHFEWYQSAILLCESARPDGHCVSLQSVKIPP
jgi:hypothetical protein